MLKPGTKVRSTLGHVGYVIGCPSEPGHTAVIRNNRDNVQFPFTEDLESR